MTSFFDIFLRKPFARIGLIKRQTVTVDPGVYIKSLTWLSSDLDHIFKYDIQIGDDNWFGSHLYSQYGIPNPNPNAKPYAVIFYDEKLCAEYKLRWC